jgi:hypothetical protein
VVEGFPSSDFINLLVFISARSINDSIFKLLTPGRSLDLLVVTENFSLFNNSPVMLSVLDVD